MQEEKRHWEAIKAGDPQALKELYTAYVDPLYGYGMILCNDADKVKDCIHDLFVSVWEGRKNFMIPHSGKAYLMASLRRKIFDKGTRIRELTETVAEVEDANDQGNDPETTWIQTEELQLRNSKLDHAVNGLSDRQREIIFMKYYQEMEYEEIGRVMNLNYQSARNLVNRALAALRKEMLAGVIFLLIAL